MIRLFAPLILLVISLTAPFSARADDFRPAYLQVTQTGPTTYDVLWKAPAISEDGLLKVQPQFPADSRRPDPPRTSFADGVAVQRWKVEIAGGLDGKSISFPGLSETTIDVLARIERADGSVQLERILPVDAQFQVESSPGSFEVAQSYAALGIEHILLGFDHLLFVAALVMLVASLRMLVWTVTSFTIAHSITLALVTLGVVSVPRPPVEAFIALSIMFVAVEIVRQRQGRPSLASQKPWLVAFAFGLLHGLGFASALAEIGLPQNNIPLALLFFNVGVEIGQLIFVIALVALAAAARRLAKPVQLHRAALAGAYAIGGLASFWMIERMAAFV